LIGITLPNGPVCVVNQFKPNKKLKTMKNKLLLLAIVVMSLSACTDNQRAKKYGGTEYIKLEPNERFINATWKDNNMWLIVQDTISGNYIVREKSSWGVLEGRVIIHK
jgi:hypothetical protein